MGHAQRRVKRPRIALTVAGADWDGPYWLDTWIDPLSETLMLRPPCLYGDWWTTNVGRFAKPDLDDYTLSSTADWLDKGHDVTGGGAGVFIQSKPTVGAWAAIPIPGKNRPVTLGLQVSDPGDDYIAAQVGWGAEGFPDLNSGVRLDLYASGIVTVWRDGVYVDKGGIGSLAGQMRTLLLIPGRKRELLILRTDAVFGGQGVAEGCRIVLSAITEEESDPELVPAGQFYVYNPSGAELFAQIVPMKFATTGYATSLTAELMQPPPAGIALEKFSNAYFPTIQNANVYAHPAFEGTTGLSFSVVKEDGTAFTPNGSIAVVRAKVTLTGDGNYTPFVYGAHTAWEAAFAETDDSNEREILSDVLGGEAGTVDLDVPDDPGGVRMTMTVVDPESIEEDVPKLRTIARRPVSAWIGGVQILDGLSEPPENHPDYSPESTTMPWAWRDAAALLETCVFREPVPLDGMELAKPYHVGSTDVATRSAVRFFLDAIGWPPARTRIDDADYRLDEIPSERSGDWNFLVEVGSNAWEGLRRLMDSHAQGWLWGFRPWTGGALFEMLDPANLTMTPHVTVYESYEAAIDGEGEDPDDPDAIDAVYGLTIDSFQESPVEIEGNEVRVTGIDPRTGRAIQAYRIDAASQDPTLDPETYPDNWLGFAKVVGATLTRLTSQAAVERATNALFEAVAADRHLASWEGQMLFRDDGEGNLVPVWRGDVVEVQGRGVYRIASFSVRSSDEPFDEEGWGAERIWRSARYVGIRTGSSPAVPRGYGGYTLAEMRQRAREAAVAYRLGDIKFSQNRQARRVTSA